MRLRPALGALIAGLVLPGLALAQTLGQGQGDTDVSWGRVIGALVFCLALAVAAAFALRVRLRGGVGALLSSNSRLTLIETVRVNQSLDICLFRFDQREFLVAATPHAVTVLESREKVPESPAEDS